MKLLPYVVMDSSGQRAAAELGSVTVPANRRDPHSSGVVDVAFLRLRGPRASSRPPIFYLAGGPGGSGIARAHRELATYVRLAQHADVVMIDPRGVNLSRPSLENIHRLDYPLSEPGDREAYLGHYRLRSRVCAEQWREWGVELDGYNAAELADDVDAVRSALGYDQIQLLGGSFGSHLGLTYLKAYPERAERVALFGIEGPDDTIKLPVTTEACVQALAERVAAQPEVAAQLPEPIEALTHVLEALDTCRRVSVPNGPEIAIGRTDVQRYFAGHLGHDQANITFAARLIKLARGDLSHLAATCVEDRTGYLSSAMSHMVDAASGLSPERAALISEQRASTLLEDFADFPMPHVRDAWGATDLGAAHRAPVHSDVPALLISGTLDGRTPPAHAEAVLAGLPHGQHLVVDGMGHGHVTLVPAILDRIEAFLCGKEFDVAPLSVPFAFAVPPHAA